MDLQKKIHENTTNKISLIYEYSYIYIAETSIQTNSLKKIFIPCGVGGKKQKPIV